jgi:RHS repeat-associated protein
VARVLYYPYGETRYTEGTLTTDYGYTGQRHEAGLGLMDYGARYYDPALGRFVSADTILPGIGGQAQNRYMYVEGNPVACTDPSGHDGGGTECTRVSKKLENGEVVEWEICRDKDGHIVYSGPPLPDVDEQSEDSMDYLPEPVPSFQRHPVTVDTSPTMGQPKDESFHFDAVGWRLEGSFPTGIPLIQLDVNVDAVLNLNRLSLANIEDNLDIFLTVGVQGIGEGAGVTTGPLGIANLPSNSELQGWGGQLGVSVIPSEGCEFNVGLTPAKIEGFTQIYYFGCGIGAEGQLGGGIGYTVNLTPKPQTTITTYGDYEGFILWLRELRDSQ